MFVRMLLSFLALKVGILMHDTHTHLTNYIVPSIFWVFSNARIEVQFINYLELLEKRIILHEGRKIQSSSTLEECDREKCLYRLMSRSAVH